MSRPLIDDGEPPVTRARTFAVESGPSNVTDPPAGTSNRLKLWNRLEPAVVPEDAGTTTCGPASAPAGPSEPSRTTCPDASCPAASSATAPAPPNARAAR